MSVRLSPGIESSGIVFLLIFALVTREHGYVSSFINFLLYEESSLTEKSPTS
jgi:hypothetical protein